MLTSTFLYIQNGHLCCHEKECLGNATQATIKYSCVGRSMIPPPPPDLPHSHLNNERQAGVMSNLSVRYRRGQPSIARQGSRLVFACRKSPQVLRNCPEGSMVGIKSLGLTDLSCLLCQYAQGTVSHNFSLERKVIYWPIKAQRP